MARFSFRLVAAVALLQIFVGLPFQTNELACAFDSIGRPMFQMPASTFISNGGSRNCWGCPLWRRKQIETTSCLESKAQPPAAAADQEEEEEVVVVVADDGDSEPSIRVSRSRSAMERRKDRAKNENRKRAIRTNHPKRRTLLLGSVAAILSSIATTPSSARASKLAVLEESENRRIEVFERNAPSVVFIDTFAEKQDVFSPNVMEVPIGTGSGFVWDKDGHIVTNYHVVRNAKFAQVALITPRKNEKKFGSPADNTLASSSTSSETDVFGTTSGGLSRTSSTNKVSSDDYKRTVFKAKVVGVDPGKDIAVLKVDAPVDLLYPIKVGKSSNLKVGQLGLAIGNPFGLDHTLTGGIISGLGREVKSPIGRPISNVIQTDAAINPGNSGGVLLDSRGMLIGMNTAIYSPSGASAGIGFAIPVDTINYIVTTLIRDGKVVRPILGIGFLESKQARALGITRGVLVLEVPPGSPAQKAGLKGTKRTETGLVEIGDIIVKIGDVIIETEANLFQALEKMKPGDIADVKVLRIDAVDDQLKQRELNLKIELQSTEALEKVRYSMERIEPRPQSQGPNLYPQNPY
uniref:PDZ domain-containing protein n=1 Tax=Pseudo-nitzschia delicatissima TaxID=44447 RepID=A0A7S0TE84_9STRA|mmetsp:Transcript_281/g.605  ORF Transcript_281/g.605 Transcript_281/m.605 type:complete len:578 (+) Transcript_281:97-1830(+)